MIKIGALIFDNGKILCVENPLWENGKNYWTIPENTIDSFTDEENLEDLCLAMLKEKTGLEGKIEKILCKNFIWETEETIFQVKITGGSANSKVQWKYLMELSDVEREWLFGKGFVGAIEEWRLDKVRILAEYREQNKSVKSGQIVFAGSSLQENFPIERFVKETYGEKIIVYNRGIGGYTTREMLCVLDDVINNLHPKALFLNIGTNDLSDASIPLETVIFNFRKIVENALEHNPGLKVYVMAYYPGNINVAVDYMIDCLKIRTNEKIASANKKLEILAKEMGLNFIDLNSAISDENGNLRPEFSVEGMHVNEEGYKAIFPLLQPILEKFI